MDLLDVLKYRFYYYRYGHFMKYIDRGAVRIDSTSSKNLPNVAFRNPDGSIVLVVANSGRKTQKLSVGWKNRGLEAEPAAESVATLVWKPSD
jgi:glucosylceramidase